MRLWLIVICLLSAVLTAVAMTPGMIFLGLAFMVVPGLVLLAAPWLFALSAAALVANLLFGRLRGAARMQAYAAFVLALVAIDAAAAWWLNRPVMAHWQELAAVDQNGAVSKEGVHAVAVLQEEAASRWNPVLCTARCQQLLYSGLVDAVLQGPGDPGATTVDPAQAVVRYHVEKRDTCPPFAVPKGVAPWFNPDVFGRKGLLEETKARIAAGDCLIAEAATLAQSDLVVVDDILGVGHEPYAADRWKLSVDTLGARRLTVYRMQNGQPILLSRQTALTAYPLFSPLLIAVGTGGGMDIAYGFVRVRKDRPGDNIDVFFEKVFGLPAPASPAGAGAVPSTILEMPRTRVHATDVPPVEREHQQERDLRAALADPALPAGSPGLLLANAYLENVARQGTADIALMSALISDRRETDFRDALRRAVEALGPAGAPLAGPLLDRIDAEIPGQGNLLRQLVSSFNALPPGAALAVMPHLESLARDEQRRVLVYAILPRLADKGPDSVPALLALMDAPTTREPAGTPDGRRGSPPRDALQRAGIAGLCRLGPAAAAAAPALFARLQPLKDAGHTTAIALAEVEALAHMGKGAELATYFTNPRVATFVAERLRKPPEPGCHIN